MAVACRGVCTRASILSSEKSFVPIRRLHLASTWRCLSQQETSTIQKIKEQSNTCEEIIIPKRIERGPTDILKALAGTVSRDYTAPHYKYHDDPFLIPASNIGKRSYALAQESGKKAAQWIFKTYPKYFEHNPAEPNIEAFVPKEEFTEKSDVSEEILRKYILNGEVTTASTIYSLLRSKGIAVNEATKLELLQLLCFHNCSDPIPEDYREEKWFRLGVGREKRKTWKDGGLADQLFESLDSKNSQAYCTLIRGMAKHLQVDRAYALYQEMQEKKLPLDVTTYNFLIPLSTYLKETGQSRWEICQHFLLKMRDENVIPNLQTFNAVLSVLSKLGGYSVARKHALETLGEMKHLGIDPSFATYYHLLNVYCKERGPSSTILYDIMDQLVQKEYEIRDSNDVFFFVTAMSVCYSHLMDKEIAMKIHKLLNTGTNYKFIGDSYKESVYYQNFFKILANTESVDVFFEYYNKFVPNVYSPEPSVMLEILQLVEVYGEWKYIPQLWTDINLFGQVSRENILEKVAEILGKYKIDGELQEQFGAIAWNLKEVMDKDNDEKIRSRLYWSGDMLGNIIQACLNAEQFDRAWELFQKTEKEPSKINGVIKAEVLSNFLDACIKKKDIKQAMFCLSYTADNEILEISKFAKRVLDSMALDEMQRTRVRSYVVDEDIQLNNKENDFEK